ncbi:MAG: insulinase family protein, partial [Geminicoccaceae bacterium]|nr:insulinase family protein [Geminicoccaceae bacterium]
TSLDPTTFRIYASPRPGVSLDDLEMAVDGEIERLLTDGVSGEEVARVKKRMLAEAVYARDSLSGAARIFGTALTTGQTVDDVEAWPERIEAVTAEEVETVARLVLDRRRSVTGKLLPSGTAETGPAEAGSGAAG